MPNHFHIFIKQTKKDKSTGKFLGDFINSYTKSINKKYKRSGVLFEGKTKNKIVYDETAFPILTRYILLNPVRANLCKNFYDYEHSSAKELLGISSEEITNKTILNYFENEEKFKKFISTDEEIDIKKIYNKPPGLLSPTPKVAP